MRPSLRWARRALLPVGLFVLLGCAPDVDEGALVGVPLNEPTEVDLVQGEAELFWQSPPGRAGLDRDELVITVTDPTGEPLDVPSAEWVTGFPQGAHIYTTLGSFDVEHDGVHTVLVEVDKEAMRTRVVADFAGQLIIERPT